MFRPRPQGSPSDVKERDREVRNFGDKADVDDDDDPEGQLEEEEKEGQKALPEGGSGDAAAPSGQLVAKEHQEVGSVGLSVFWRYFK